MKHVFRHDCCTGLIHVNVAVLVAAFHLHSASLTAGLQININLMNMYGILHVIIGSNYALWWKWCLKYKCWKWIQFLSFMVVFICDIFLNQTNYKLPNDTCLIMIITLSFKNILCQFVNFHRYLIYIYDITKGLLNQTVWSYFWYIKFVNKVKSKCHLAHLDALEFPPQISCL